MAQVLVYPDYNDLEFKNADRRIEGNAVFQEAHDYLKIMIISSEKNSYSNYVGRGGGGGVRNSTNNTFEVLQTIFLYMPHQLSESFQAGYNTDSLGMLGASAMRMANQRGDTASMAASLKDAANGLKPEVGMSALASAISGVADVTGVGGQVNVNTISQLTRGKILNPYKELTFQGVDFRAHSFSFKLTVNTSKDINVIQNILQALRIAMHPDLSGADKDEQFGAAKAENKTETNNESSATPGAKDPKAKPTTKPATGASAAKPAPTPPAAKPASKPGLLDPGGGGTEDRWLTIPDFFKLELVRIEKGGGVGAANASRRLTSLVRFPVYCVLEGMTVNFTPDGSYQPLKEFDGDTTKDLGVLSYQLDLQFRETGMITKSNLK